MGTPTSITVYFACPHCNLIYRARQVLFAERASGQLECVNCGEAVHSWNGVYNYLRWKPVHTEVRNRGASARPGWRSVWTN
jgi:transcription elongation factor Elf1